MDAERMRGAGLLLSEGDLGRETSVPGCDLGNSFRSLENGSMGFRARAIIREASSSHSPGPPLLPCCMTARTRPTNSCMTGLALPAADSEFCSSGVTRDVLAALLGAGDRVTPLPPSSFGRRSSFSGAWEAVLVLCVFVRRRASDAVDPGHTEKAGSAGRSERYGRVLRI